MKFYLFFVWYYIWEKLEQIYFFKTFNSENWWFWLSVAWSLLLLMSRGLTVLLTLGRLQLLAPSRSGKNVKIPVHFCKRLIFPLPLAKIDSALAISNICPRFCPIWVSASCRTQPQHTELLSAVKCTVCTYMYVHTNRFIVETKTSIRLASSFVIIGSHCHLTADLDPTFHFNADPDPDPFPNQSLANLRLLVYKPSTAHVEPPRLHCERPRPFIAPFWFFSLNSTWILTLMRIQVQLFALMWIRIPIWLPKIMRIHMDSDPQPCKGN